ncbi:MAG: DUF4494 domain-containing protein [Bacteroidales bacterium]|nr:DUF4494 domain-containing protein [Bacteroidales bacterium]
MNIWFLCKVRYVKVDEHGKEKKTTEPYLVDAVSFSDAEKRMYYLMEQYIHGEFSITNIAKTNFNDVFNFDDAQLWYKCKITYNDVDEKTEKVKPITNYALVAANDVKDAFDRVHECYKEMLVQFEVPSIQESPVVDVFPYFAMDDRILDGELKPIDQPVNSEFETKQMTPNPEFEEEEGFIDELPDDELNGEKPVSFKTEEE